MQQCHYSQRSAGQFLNTTNLKFPWIQFQVPILPNGIVSLSGPLSGPQPPTDVTAVQDGPTSITVTWTPPDPLDGITGYTIFYTGGGSNDETTVNDGNTMSHALTGLTNGETYTISIVATSSGLSSAPVQATVGLGMSKH